MLFNALLQGIGKSDISRTLIIACVSYCFTTNNSVLAELLTLPGLSHNVIFEVGVDQTPLL